jgi:hypothetical protein
VNAIQDRLGGALFVYFVEETLPLSLEDVPLYVQEAMLFSHVVPLSILRFACAVGLTATFWTDGFSAKVR